MANEGVPSKAIWDPSVSSNSSIASISTNNSDKLDALEDFGLGEYPAPESRIPTSTFTSAIESLPIETETDLRMRILEDDAEDYEDDGISALLTNSITNAHGSSDNTMNSSFTSNATAKSEQKNRAFGTDRDERQRFIEYMSNRSEKQLRLLLWDSFRLARVILGQPVKDKKRLSHKSILNSIRQVAQLKIENRRMLKELERLREQKKKHKWGKERQIQHVQSPEEREDGASSFETPEKIPSSPCVIEDPDKSGAKKWEEEMKILQVESDLAMSQIKKIKGQRKASIFESPSSSSEEDDVSYTLESPTEMLHPYGSRIEEVSQPTGAQEPKSANNDQAEEDEIVRVLQRVIALENEQHRQQLGVDPEITTSGKTLGLSTSASAVHKDVISLLNSLVQNPLSDKVAPKAPESEVKQSPAIVPRKISVEDFDEDEHPEIATLKADIAAEKERKSHSIQNLNVHKRQLDIIREDIDKAKKQAAAKREKVELELRRYRKELDDLLAEEAERAKDVKDIDSRLDDLASEFHRVNDEIDEDKHREVAKIKADIAAAKKRKPDSIQNLNVHKRQLDIIREDIDKAKKEAAAKREKEERELRGYRKELDDLLAEEKERANHIESIDSELDDKALHYVDHEDTEAELHRKHEGHKSALSQFRKDSKNHSAKYREYLKTVDRHINEQSGAVLRKSGKVSEDSDYEKVPPTLRPEATGDKSKRVSKNLFNQSRGKKVDNK